MKITSVGIYANRKLMGLPRTEKGRDRVSYEDYSNYLTLAISAWVKRLKLDLGEFNRLHFTEADSLEMDCTIIGNKVFNVYLEDKYIGVEQFVDAPVTHAYFLNQYIAGFKRFDAHFGLNLTSELVPYLESYFKDGLQYEYKRASKKIAGARYTVLDQFKYDAFNLILRVENKAGETINESVLATSIPCCFRRAANYINVKIVDNAVKVHGTKADLDFPLEPYLIH